MKLAKNTAIAAITTGVRSGATSITSNGPSASHGTELTTVASRPMPGRSPAEQTGDRQRVRDRRPDQESLDCGDGRRDQRVPHEPPIREPLTHHRGERRPGDPERTGSTEDLPCHQQDRDADQTEGDPAAPRLARLSHRAPGDDPSGSSARVSSSARAWNASVVRTSRARGARERHVAHDLDATGALGEDHDAIGEEDRLLDRVRDEQRRDGQLAPDPLQLQVQTSPGDRIHGTRRARRARGPPGRARAPWRSRRADASPPRAASAWTRANPSIPTSVEGGDMIRIRFPAGEPVRQRDVLQELSQGSSA